MGMDTESDGEGNRKITETAAMKLHKLKTWPIFFQAVIDLKKPFELRRQDRDFAEGDILHLQEWDDEKKEYTGRDCWRIVTYVLSGTPHLAAGYCALGMRQP